MPSDGRRPLTRSRHGILPFPVALYGKAWIRQLWNLRRLFAYVLTRLHNGTQFIAARCENRPMQSTASHLDISYRDQMNMAVKGSHITTRRLAVPGLDFPLDLIQYQDHYLILSQSEIYEPTDVWLVVCISATIANLNARVVALAFAHRDEQVPYVTHK